VLYDSALLDIKENLFIHAERLPAIMPPVPQFKKKKFQNFTYTYIKNYVHKYDTVFLLFQFGSYYLIMHYEHF